ncbi:MAG TPA: hypothetical protein VHZ24_13800 [Pirellulales bacterium]|nr:hypothetical protein [Pirellulales bacterium]
MQLDDLADKLAVLPNAERIAVGVQQVGKRLQLFPLLLVVASIAAWVGALAWRFHLHVADKHVSQRDGVIGPSLEHRQRRLADRRNPLSFEAKEFREVAEEPFERGAKLILWFARGARICEFRFRLGAKAGNRLFQIKHYMVAAAGLAANANDDLLTGLQVSNHSKLTPKYGG